MKPHDLLQTARVLLSSGKGKPTAASLRRATSSVYYAIFHCLAGNCADLLVGGSGSCRSKPAWQQVYRSLEHGFIKHQCKQENIMKKFPQDIQDFGNIFVAMQEKRHDADYDPFKGFVKSIVKDDLIQVESVIERFQAVSSKDRRAFCVYVLLKTRKS